jgi:hypothetical protein
MANEPVSVDQIIAALRSLAVGPVSGEQLQRALSDLENKLHTKFEANDKAVDLLHEDQVRVPTLLDRSVDQVKEVMGLRVDALHALTNERFMRIDAAFTALATLTDKLSLANATALTAALSAAEKAVGEQNRSSSLAISKSEQGTNEAIKQLGANFSTEIKSIASVVANLQSRLDRGEGTAVGVNQPAHNAQIDALTNAVSALVARGTERRDYSATLINVIVAVAAVAAVILTVHLH